VLDHLLDESPGVAVGVGDGEETGADLLGADGLAVSYEAVEANGP
jgi:hypothetical protein